VHISNYKHLEEAANILFLALYLLVSYTVDSPSLVLRISFSLLRVLKEIGEAWVHRSGGHQGRPFTLSDFSAVVLLL
jgi:hypothetical protein